MKNIALITGASSGMGKEFAHIHAEKGGDLILIARREDRLKEVKQELENKYNTKVLLIVKDLTANNATKEIYDIVKQKELQINYLINNAGFGGIGKFHERDVKDDLNMINLNISVLTELTHLFLKDFVSWNKGKILNVSSTVSQMPGPLQAVYFASKAYVTSFSNAISEELHDTNVTVTNLMPGATETEFGTISGMNKTSLFDKPANARKVAEDGYNGMLKGKLDVISGLPFSQKLLGLFMPIIPKKGLLKQIRQMQTVKN